MNDQSTAVLQPWTEVQYGELSALLSYLMFLKQLHQTHHWVVSKSDFYSNHLLFQRIYEGIDPEIDLVAEKAIGLGSVANINSNLHAEQIANLFDMKSQLFGSDSECPIVDCSLYFESQFQVLTSVIFESLKSKSQLTRGLDNLIAGLEDAHETWIYLLKQAQTRR